MYEVRTVTIHAGHRILKNLDRVNDEISRLATMAWEAVDRLKEEHGVRTGMTRVTLPDSPQDRILDTVSSIKMDGEDDGFIVSIGNIPVYHPYLEDIALEAASKGLYLSILFRPPVEDNAYKLSLLLTRLSREDINLPTRVGVNVYGRQVYTPYYPLSSSPGDRDYFSIALTYPNHLLASIGNGGIKKAEKTLEQMIRDVEDYAKTLSASMGMAYLGVDLSLSPWMEESVGRLVEKVSGERLGRPASAYGVYVLNTIIERAAGKTLTTGFNEIQLPVAEDNLLKERGLNGEITAEYLAMLTGVCLAGLDLVVIPEDPLTVRNLILDVFSYSLTKNKPLGVRLVTVDAEPGERVKFEKFGETPVISPY